MCDRLLLRKEGVATLLAHPDWSHTGNITTLLLEILAVTFGPWPPQEIEPQLLHLCNVTKRVASAGIQLGANYFGSS